MNLVRPGQVKAGLSPSFFYSRDPSSGELRGFGIALADALARALGHDLLLHEYADPHASILGLRARECDLLLFLGIDPSRTGDVAFSAPYVQADYTFLIPRASTVVAWPDLDRGGQRIAVVRGHKMELELAGKLLQAVHVHADTPDDAFELLRTGRVDAMAGIRPGLVKYAARLDGSRVLADGFGRNRLAMAVARENVALLRRLNDFIAASRASGLLHRMARDAGLDQGNIVDE